MSSEKIHDLIKRYFEYWDSNYPNQFGKTAELYTEDAVWFRSKTSKLEGKEELREFYEGGRGGFVEALHKIDDIVVEGDRAACHGSADLKTEDGKKVYFRFADIFVIKDGKFHRVYTYLEPETI